MRPPTLLAVPNVSEGRSEMLVAEIGRAFLEGGTGALRLLDVHADADHHRSVFTLAGSPGDLAEGLLAGARRVVAGIDVVSRFNGDPREHGQHPHVGALDVVPIVYLDPGSRGAACAEALVLGDRIAEELCVPVFLYGELTSDGARPPRTRAELRRGGVAGLEARMHEGIAPDFGPSAIHPSAGATLVCARPPLVAFNLQLEPPATLADARRIAALIREGGERGLPGVRAIGVLLTGGIAQVSMNVERPFDVPLAAVVEAVRALTPVASAELVGVAPRRAFEGFPPELPIPGFDPARHVIENALGC
jgi:glutamate formiminotransferase/glutamate formiminotransferase/formiminotetrahydrofolate cyclodeaminase